MRCSARLRRRHKMGRATPTVCIPAHKSSQWRAQPGVCVVGRSAVPLGAWRHALGKTLNQSLECGLLYQESHRFSILQKRHSRPTDFFSVSLNPMCLCTLAHSQGAAQGAPSLLPQASEPAMTDSSPSTSTAPENTEAVAGYSPPASPLPNPAPGRGALLAGVAALASVALIFLLPRVGGRFTGWRRSVAGLGLLASPRDR